MPVYKTNNLFNGAYYNGHPVNGKFRSDQTLFDNVSYLTVHYLNIIDDTQIKAKSIKIPAQHTLDFDSLNLPYLNHNSTFSGFTDQEIKGDYLQDFTNNRLGIDSIEPIDHTLHVNYYLAPIRTWGKIYVHYIKGDLVHRKKRRVKTVCFTGQIGTRLDYGLVFSFVNSTHYRVSNTVINADQSIDMNKLRPKTQPVTFDYEDKYVDVDLMEAPATIQLNYCDKDMGDPIIYSQTISGSNNQPFDLDFYLGSDNLPNQYWSEPTVIHDNNYSATKKAWGDTPRFIGGVGLTLDIQVQTPASSIVINYLDPSNHKVLTEKTKGEADDPFDYQYYLNNVPGAYQLEKYDTPPTEFPNPYLTPSPYTWNIHVELQYDDATYASDGYYYIYVYYVATYPLLNEPTVFEAQVSGKPGDTLGTNFKFKAPSGFKFNTDGSDPVFTQYHQSSNLSDDTLQKAQDTVFGNTDNVTVAVIPTAKVQFNKSGTLTFGNLSNSNDQTATPLEDTGTDDSPDDTLDSDSDSDNDSDSDTPQNNGIGYYNKDFEGNTTTDEDDPDTDQTYPNEGDSDSDNDSDDPYNAF